MITRTALFCRVGCIYLILIEASLLSHGLGTLTIPTETQVKQRRKAKGNFILTSINIYCGIDLHARTMYLCILNQAGDIVLHRNLKTDPALFLKLIAPYREDLVVVVECIFTWYWLADLCAREGIPLVLGQALYRKTIHGGKAKNDKIDAHKIAALLRGGMLPQAYVYPAAMRSTRDLLRRRLHWMRKRAERLAHLQNTNSQDNLPEIGKSLPFA